MKYKILSLDRKTTSTGKGMIKATLEGIDHTTTDGVAIWEGFPLFESLKVGDFVDGDLVSKENGQYVNVSLYAPKTPKTASGFTKSPSAVNKAMERKETSIAKFQTNKEESIAKAGAQRDSVLMVTTFYANKGWEDDELKFKVEEWYKYFLNLGEQPFI